MFTYDSYLQSLYQIKQEQGVKGLQNINDDCIAYLECDDLDVHLPIVQTKNKQDEQFYLTHDFKKRSNEFGSPYQRSDSQFGTTDNAVFEGHSTFVESLFNHKKSQTIFGAFNNYLQKNSNYNYLIKIETPTQIFTYKVVSAISFNTKSTDISRQLSIYQTTIFSSRADFDVFYDNIKQCSVLGELDDAEYGDKFLTIFTCSNIDLDYRVMIVLKQLSAELI